MTNNPSVQSAPAAPLHNEPAVTPELGAEHGLSSEEYNLMLEIIGRQPSFTELGIFSVMWSEHCSYKSSRIWLSKLPTSGPQVIQGPGENAGVIDIGDGQAAVFKMESHNHPSFIEPYEGAATGVGGIMRDVFTMGARPIANLNALRFGSPDHPKTRHLVSGVVAGIAGYGNCMGVPTVGGETNFHPSYNGNILVNAMTVGIAEQDRIFYSRGATPGNPVVYVGSKTGRDGIHGATMASAEFDDAAEAQRPTVQVGDPFTEKLLLEACLELMQQDAIISIQDMGAAGLTSSTVEIADKGGIGVELDLDKVPQRETGMTPYEIMLSESQERMLMVLKPGHEDKARAIFEKWELDFAVIGKTTDTGRLVLKMHGRIWCDIPVPPLVDQAPKYNRPTEPTPPQPPIDICDTPLKGSVAETLTTLIACPDIASKRWIWEQYDCLVGGDTLIGPGTSRNAGDAAVVHIREHERKALALSSDCTPRYCHADPVEGGKQAVAESWRNISAVGAQPLAVTDNMNFGNPERPRIMGQFAGCIEGMAAACTALDYPVVSGNVSLYNETNGQGILPTPTIGGVGLLQDAGKAMTMDFKSEGETILLLGQPDTPGHIGQSLYLREIHDREDGPPPPVDLDKERKNGDFIRAIIRDGQISACHDISDGGLLIALAEMALAVPPDKREIGARISLPNGANAVGFLFGEDQGRYIVTTRDAATVIARANTAGVSVLKLGTTGGTELICEHHATIGVSKLRTLHENWLPDYMSAA